MATLAGPAVRTGRELVSDELFGRLVNRVAAHPDVDHGMAERVTDQMLAFLAASGDAGQPLAPSPLLDVGWHAFSCTRRSTRRSVSGWPGRFIHHVPDDAPDGPPTDGAPAVAVAAMEEAGYVVDRELWSGAASCGNCHEEGNCSASGTDGNENSDSRKK